MRVETLATGYRTDLCTHRLTDREAEVGRVFDENWVSSLFMVKTDEDDRPAQSNIGADEALTSILILNTSMYFSNLAHTERR